MSQNEHINKSEWISDEYSLLHVYLCWSAMTIGMSVYTAVSLSVVKIMQKISVKANTWQRHYDLLATIHQGIWMTWLQKSIVSYWKMGKRNFIWCLSLIACIPFYVTLLYWDRLFVFSFSTTFTWKAFVLIWRVTYQGNTTGGIKQSFQKHSLVSNTVQHVPEELSWAGIRWMKPLAHDRHRFHPRGTV